MCCFVCCVLFLLICLLCHSFCSLFGFPANFSNAPCFGEPMDKFLVISPTNPFFNLLLSDKRVSKSYIKQLNVPSLVSILLSNDFHPSKSGILLLGISKSVYFSYKWLVDDVGTFLAAGLSKPTIRKDKSKPTKSTILGIAGNNIFIDDRMLELVDSSINQHADSLLLPSADEPTLNMNVIDGMDFPNIEMVRDGTADPSLHLDASLSVNKRRRVFEDHQTELPPEELKLFKRSSNDICNLISTPDTSEILQIHPKIINLFLNEANKPVEVPEQVRASALDTFIDDFASNLPSAILSDQHSVELADNKNILDNLPDNFIFNEIVMDYSVVDKSAHFASLLLLASRGAVIPKQELAYGPICCTKVI